jgi:signal transduction histidine kinase
VLRALQEPGSARGARHAGGGLGLSIVRRILEIHSSRLELESSERGTCVRFALRS